jgi:TRAP transporter TAXI family solute receptor
MKTRMKKRSYIIAGILVLALITAVGISSSVAGQTRFYTVGTGGITGVYYPVGSAIARMINEKRDKYHMRLTVESTGGSVYNINALMAGDIDFGMVQSDRQYQAVHGLAEWKSRGPQKELRALFSLYPESVTLLAGADTGINSISDLKGKHVNIGNPGSGQRQNAIDALTAAGIDIDRDMKVENLKAVECPEVLLDGRIDAFFYTVGHPSGVFKEAVAGRRKVKFIPLVLPESFYRKFPYYTPSVVPMSFYPEAANKADLPTFGVVATLVTRASMPEKDVYRLVKEVFENLDEFKELHPALSTLTKRGMIRGLAAPLHPGALKYYREAGLID